MGSNLSGHGLFSDLFQFSFQFHNPSSGPGGGCIGRIQFLAFAKRSDMNVSNFFRYVIVNSTRTDDDVSKKIADIHITPFSKGQELDAANAASARARARIMELERELEEITKKAMTTQVRAH